ncbi:MAG: hypothetical protein F6J92_09800 [Symploca sp. SIO1A3]|nr:hypothetical protein [Symploca sp. SIO1A3]
MTFSNIIISDNEDDLIAQLSKRCAEKLAASNGDDWVLQHLPMHDMESIVRDGKHTFFLYYPYFKIAEFIKGRDFDDAVLAARRRYPLYFG